LAGLGRPLQRQSGRHTARFPSRSTALSLSVVPPSVNALFFNRPKGKGRGLTLAYRNWRAFADRELRDQPPWHVPGRVEVRIYLPAVTRGDADNRIKATLDALVCAGRIEDDRNVVKVGAEFSTLEETRILIQGRPA
jgi:Holliday junction resolvase RusA-like endonuclease